MPDHARAWWAAGSGLAIVVLIVWFGVAMDRASLSLADCIEEPDRCEGRELYIGYARVLSVRDRSVSLRSWLGPVQATPWPADSPLPSPGLSVSLLATHVSGATVTPHLVREHPYRLIKERTGLIMLVLWVVLLALWVRVRRSELPQRA